MDTLILISQILGVTVDYLLKGEDLQIANQGYYVSSEMITGFLNYKRHIAKWIAVGISLLLFSSNFYMLENNVTGTILECLFTVSGIAILIWQNFIPNHYKILYHEKLLFHEVTVRDFTKKYYTNRRIYGVMLIIGVAIIIITNSIYFLLLSYDYNREFVSIIEMTFFIVVIALFVFCGILIKAETFILGKMEYKSTNNNKWFYVAFPLTLLGLILALLYNTWSPLLPIFILICLLLYQIYKRISRGGKQDE